jgi:ELP3 family radical SAM enzyme/protein acetyltransferase
MAAVDIEDIVHDESEKIYVDPNPNATVVLTKLIDMVPLDPDTMNKTLNKLKMSCKFQGSRNILRHHYRFLTGLGKFEVNKDIESVLIKKPIRGWSGVVVIAISTSPTPMGQSFSCKFDCAYCPKQPKYSLEYLESHPDVEQSYYPRSYMRGEPTVERGIACDFDPIKQFRLRIRTLIDNGHPIDKIEFIVLGGTFASYPIEYQINFLRDLYHAANTWDSETPGPKLTLHQEQMFNMVKTTGRVIGLTIETRPGMTDDDLIRWRMCGVTRLQIGIQHTDNEILKRVRRKSTFEEATDTIYRCKQIGLKVDIHLMPDLPGSDPALDKKMFETVLYSPYIQADQWKIYPCEVVPHTAISDWFRDGEFAPYGSEGDSLMSLLIWVKEHVHPWIRLNRVIRDFKEDEIEAGNPDISLRDTIHVRMKKEGKFCRCIRCREAKNKNVDLAQTKIMTRQYDTVGGTEYFISCESLDEKHLYGLLRLRIDENPGGDIFPILHDCALIRELHVYGRIMEKDTRSKRRVQHRGIGTMLMKEAEKTAINLNYEKMAIISGVGVREYYRKKHGYRLVDTYMVKNLHKPWTQMQSFWLLLLIVIMPLIGCFISLFVNW